MEKETPEASGNKGRTLPWQLSEARSKGIGLIILGVILGGVSVLPWPRFFPWVSAAGLAFFVIGFIEVVTGGFFQKLSEKWDSLKGWQRGVLGVFAVIIAFAVMIAFVCVYENLKDK